MARTVEEDIALLLQARTEQIPLWHDIVDRGVAASVQEGLELAYALLDVHREVILRLAREVDLLELPNGPD
jgi:hypothetical protein